MLDIARMGGKGDGVSADGVFVGLTLPGETVEARVEGGRGMLTQVIAASADRIAPACPHFGACGGCALQHWASAPALAWKAERIREALARQRLEAEILSPFAAPPRSRRRLALHARRRGRETVVGFKARRSWSLVPIATCPVAHPLLEDALPALAALAAPFTERPASAPTLHVTLTDTGLDVEVTGVARRGGPLSADSRTEAARLAAAYGFARVTLDEEVLFQDRAPVVRLDGVAVALPPGAFLQAVPQAERAMTAFAAEAAAGARRIADLYCGVGTFTFALAKLAPVRAADASAPAIAALRSAHGGAPGLAAVSAEARDLDRRPLLAEDLAGTDVVLFDPPRAGAEAQCRQLARSKVQRVIGVSCDPVSFARDARILADGGLRLRSVLPVDQFLWSSHIELVSVFDRGGR